MKKLGMVLTPQDELRKLINEHPDVKIVVCADADLCNCNGDYRSYYAPAEYEPYWENVIFIWART